MNKQYTIQVSVLLENSLWVAIFERNDDEGFAVARQIFGTEPTDPELYEFVSNHFFKLKFSEPITHFKLVIKRKNFKRVSREVRKEMKKITDPKKESFAQEALRLEQERNKKLRKTASKIEKEAQQVERFLLKQDKKKQKKRGH